VIGSFGVKILLVVWETNFYEKVLGRAKKRILLVLSSLFVMVIGRIASFGSVIEIVMRLDRGWLFVIVTVRSVYVTMVRV
jgi:hypothetical protein